MRSRVDSAVQLPHAGGARWFWPVASILALLTVLVYWPVGGHAFVEYDDGDYVVENAIVQRGLTWEGVRWAFGTTHASNWHPLTWLSHMLDCELFGLRAGPHHLVNLGFHVASTLLLLAVLVALSGRLWPATLAAATFALHPLHVESVAWIAERKDVLSSCFGFGALLAYVYYTQRQPAGVVEERTFRSGVSAWYAVAVACFACSLMSKPMWVTLPGILVLLDYWPLRRLTPFQLRERPGVPLWAMEKIPFVVLSIAASGVTWLAQRQATVMPLETYGLTARLGNALVACATYLRQLIWPADLAFFYPLTSHTTWRIVASALVVGAISALVGLRRRAWPFAAVGWWWFLLTLGPVIGLVQVGEQGHADRYTYLPSVGLFVWLAYGLDAWLAGRPALRPAISGVALLAVAGLGMGSRIQVGYWRDSRALFERALAVTQDNWLAHNNLGAILAREGDLSAALYHFQEALRIKPDYLRACRNLAAGLVQAGRLDEAVSTYRQALSVSPDDPASLRGLGTTLARRGDLQEASALCARAVGLAPDDALARYDYGVVLKLQGQWRAAADQFEAALRLMPDDPQTHFELGSTLVALGDIRGGLTRFARANALRPDWPEALAAQAWILATSEAASEGAAIEALRLATRANELTGNNRPDVLATLAAAYAATGRFPEAASTAARALALAEQAGLSSLARQMRARLRLYEAGTSQDARDEHVQPPGR